MSETVGVTVSRNTVASPKKATRHNTRCLGGVALSRCHDARRTAPQRPSPSLVPSWRLDTRPDLVGVSLEQPRHSPTIERDAALSPTRQGRIA